VRVRSLYTLPALSAFCGSAGHAKASRRLV
jgi:hypothetical protein